MADRDGGVGRRIGRAPAPRDRLRPAEVALGAGLLPLAWLAEQAPVPGTFLLLTGAALFLWYRVRMTT